MAQGDVRCTDLPIVDINSVELEDMNSEGKSVPPSANELTCGTTEGTEADSQEQGTNHETSHKSSDTEIIHAADAEINPTYNAENKETKNETDKETKDDDDQEPHLPPVFSMPLFVYDDNHFPTPTDSDKASAAVLEELEEALSGIYGIDDISSTGSFESDVVNHPTYISQCDDSAYIDFQNMESSSHERQVPEDKELENIAGSLVRDTIESAILKVSNEVKNDGVPDIRLNESCAEFGEEESAGNSDGASNYLKADDQVTKEPSELEVDVIEEASDHPNINIDIFDTICFPTKLVNGMVTMERDYDISRLTLSLVCEGSQTISWCIKSYSQGIEGKLIERKEKIFESQTFFTDYADLIHRDLGDDKLNFAFSYQFPPNLPSSFNYTQTDGKQICGTIEYSFILLDIKENEVIAKKTMNLYEAPPYHYIPLPMSDSIKVFYLSCINKGDVQLKAETDKGCYFFGDVAQVRCCITNNASEKISSIGVTLCRYLHFKDAKFNECKLRHIVHHQQFKDVESNTACKKSYETILNFELLGGETQSVSSSQLINCRYVLRVSIKIRYQADLYVDLEVILYKPNKDLETKGSKLVLDSKENESPTNMTPDGSAAKGAFDSSSQSSDSSKSISKDDSSCSSDLHNLAEIREECSPMNNMESTSYSDNEDKSSRKS